jgi:hypothetical protein
MAAPTVAPPDGMRVAFGCGPVPSAPGTSTAGRCASSTERVVHGIRPTPAAPPLPPPTYPGPSLEDLPAALPWAMVRLVTRWTEPAPTVTSGGSPSCGRTTVADPRLSHLPRKGVFRVQRWDRPSSTVVGQPGVGRSNGGNAVADPRLACTPRSGAFGVLAWDAPARAVTSWADVQSGQESRVTRGPDPGRLRERRCECAQVQDTFRGGRAFPHQGCCGGPRHLGAAGCGSGGPAAPVVTVPMA